MNLLKARLINMLTWYRLAAVPVLIALLLEKQFDTFKWFLAFSFFTDAIDGWLARRLGVTSLRGARLDSLADDLTVFAAIFGIFYYHFDFIQTNRVLVGIIALLYLIQNILALVRYRKLTSFHTYAAKIAAVCQGVFLTLFYFQPDLPLFFFKLAAVLTIADLAEEILLVILLPLWQANVKGLYWALKKD